MVEKLAIWDIWCDWCFTSVKNWSTDPHSYPFNNILLAKEKKKGRHNISEVCLRSSNLCQSWMNGNEIKRLTAGEKAKEKSDTAQSCWELEKGEMFSTVVQYYKCNSGLSSILWSWQSNSESVWKAWRLSMLPSHLITTQSCRIRQGPVFTASYWHCHSLSPNLSPFCFLELSPIFFFLISFPLVFSILLSFRLFLWLNLFFV